METIILSLLLMTGTSAADSGAESSGVRAQATAHARIVSGEAIRFEAEVSSVVSAQRLNGGRTFLLSTAHSKGAIEEFSESTIVEFH